MEYVFLSFLAGILTVLAPCVFTLLPIILGGSLQTGKAKRAFLIILSLLLSIIIFTLILRASTALIQIPQSFWSVISGMIIISIGLISIFPDTWNKLSFKLGLQRKSDKLLDNASHQKGLLGDVLTGAALGPVFSSCSPTYALIIAVILPQDFFVGFINLLVYALGLGLILGIISILGQKFIKRMKWAVNPKGVFKKVLGILFVLVGIMILTGFDKTLETFLLDNGLFDPTGIELDLMEEI